MTSITSNKVVKIADNDHMILWKLPQGVLDTNLSSKDEIDNRKAVSKSTGLTCWVDVFQYLLHGAHSIDNTTASKVDVAVTSFRERLNKNNEFLKLRPVAKALLEHSDYNLSHPILAQTFAHKVIELFEQNSVKFSQELKLLKIFCSQKNTTNFKKFFDDQVDLENTESYLAFFKEMQITPLEHIPQQIVSFYYPGTYKKLDDLPINIQNRIVNVVGKRVLAQEYGLSSSSWNPVNGIDVLFQEVKKHKVIGFGGFFGKNCYTKPPHFVSEFNGQKLFGWAPSERKPNDTGHYIAVVGVKKESDQEKIKIGKVGHVVYIDPVDGTDPNNPDQQQFYIISYETFSKNVNTEFNFLISVDKFQIFEKSFLTDVTSIKAIGYGLLPNPPYICDENN